MAVSLAAVLALIFILFGITVLFERTPAAIRFLDSRLGLFFGNQTPRKMDLQLDLDTVTAEATGTAGIRGSARIDMTVDPGWIGFFFGLNPALKVIGVRWEGRNLGFGRIGPFYRVGFPDEVSSEKAGVLEIDYSGDFRISGSKSVITHDLIYLDPDDAYYPRVSNGAMDVDLRVTFPSGFMPVAPASSAKPADPDRFPHGTGRTCFEWSLARPVQAFAVAGCRTAPIRMTVGEIPVALCPLGAGPPGLMENLEVLYGFFERSLPAVRPESMNFILMPESFAGGLRCDGAGTLLVPRSLSIDEQAFAFGLLWMAPKLQAGSKPLENSLFSREEIAMGWAIRFVSQGRSRGEDGICAFKRVDLFSPGGSCLPRQSLSVSGRERSGREDKGVEFGGFLLDVVRRLVGNDTFEEVCLEILRAPPGSDNEDLWSRCCKERGVEGLDWLFRDWARNRLDLDLVVADLSVQPLKKDCRIRVVIENQGDLDFRGKVGIDVVTDNKIIPNQVTLSSGRAVWKKTLSEEGVVGVVIDPDYEWPDVDRSNNTGYIKIRPRLVIPSPLNNWLAAALERDVKRGDFPLVVTDSGFRRKRTFYFDSLVSDLVWLNENRLLVRTGRKETGEEKTGFGSSWYLVEADRKRIKFLGSDVLLSPSPSGDKLLINEWRGSFWQHRLKDLDEKRERSFLNRIFHRLEFIEGRGLVRAVMPPGSRERVALYSTEEKVAYVIPVHGVELTDIKGCDDGIFFVGSRGKRTELFLYRDSTARVESCYAAEGKEIRYCLDRAQGDVIVWETVPLRKAVSDATGVLRIILVDPVAHKTCVLYDGNAAGLFPFYHDKGFLIIDREGTRLLFRRYDDESEQVVWAGTCPLKVLGLVDDRRFLYYSRIMPAGGFSSKRSIVPGLSRERFYRYDFFDCRTEEIVF